MCVAAPDAPEEPGDGGFASSIPLCSTPPSSPISRTFDLRFVSASFREVCAFVAPLPYDHLQRSARTKGLTENDPKELNGCLDLGFSFATMRCPSSAGRCSCSSSATP
jgi:hypothetical protein